MAAIYRVIDCSLDTVADKCYVYVRDICKVRSTIILKPRYEIFAGSNNQAQLADLEEMCDKLAGTKGVVSMRNLGEQQTYYRGRKYLLSVLCANYVSYSRILSKLKYDHSCFVCDDFCTIENKTLMHYGLYGATYVHCEGSSIRAATVEEQFAYEPEVAGIDLEMLTLNPVDPECVLYLASYYSDKITVLIYTADYAGDIVATNSDNAAYNTSKVVFIRVQDKYALVHKLAEVIAHEAPDVVTGHNIYTADFPLLYFVLNSTLTRWPNMCIGADPYFQYTKKLEKRYFDSEAGIVIKIPGCHITDTYFYLDKTLASEDKTSLKLGDVSARYLGADKDPLTYKDLEAIYYSGSTEDKKLVMKYCARDSYLTVQLYKKFNVWNQHSGTYSISGVDAQKRSCTGEVEVTHGMCYRKAKAMHVYLDPPTTRMFPPTGGLVLRSMEGLFRNMQCIDFTSLYPSIVMQHNIDAMTVLNSTRAQLTKKHGEFRDMGYYALSADAQVVGLRDRDGAYVYFDQTIQAILPSVLQDLLSERNAIKRELANHDKHSMEYLTLLGQEQARKLGANGACGALAERTEGNPVAYCQLNDIITTTGRYILNIAQEAARVRSDVVVIYGDTDSLMLFATDEGVSKYLEAVHSLLPQRIRFKVEYKSDMFIMGKKKHYIASVDGKPKIVGYKAVKSSSCKMVQTIFRWLIEKLVAEGPSNILAVYEYMLDEYERTVDTLDLNLLASNFSYTGKTYKKGSYRGQIVQCMMSRGIELIAGNTLSIVTIKTEEDYLRVYGQASAIQLPNKHSGKASRICTLDEVASYPQIVDVRGIIETQCGGDLRTILKYCQSVYTAPN